MSLESSTLAAIQQAGAAAYVADTDLKQATQNFAARVAAAMQANPFGLGNDTLFENWKLTARLSQSMTAIEAELKKIYFLAEELTGDGASVMTAMPALPAPATLSATDVKVKSRPRTKARRPTSRVSTPSTGAALPINAAKLLKYLETVLNADEFKMIQSSVSARAVGMPLGSVSAAIKNLVAHRRLVMGPAGGFKLSRLDADEVLV